MGHLVLTRKPHQSIQIGDTQVIILEIRGNQVRIGIDAPKEINILRTELIGRYPDPSSKKEEFEPDLEKVLERQLR